MWIYPATVGSVSVRARVLVRLRAAWGIRPWLGRPDRWNALGAGRQLFRNGASAPFRVTADRFYEPTANRTHDMAAHHRTAIIPARLYIQCERGTLERGHDSEDFLPYPLPTIVDDDFAVLIFLNFSAERIVGAGLLPHPTLVKPLHHWREPSPGRPNNQPA